MGTVWMVRIVFALGLRAHKVGYYLDGVFTLQLVFRRIDDTWPAGRQRVALNRSK